MDLRRFVETMQMHKPEQQKMWVKRYEEDRRKLTDKRNPKERLPFAGVPLIISKQCMIFLLSVPVGHAELC